MSFLTHMGLNNNGFSKLHTLTMVGVLALNETVTAFRYGNKRQSEPSYFGCNLNQPPYMYWLGPPGLWG